MKIVDGILYFGPEDIDRLVEQTGCSEEVAAAVIDVIRRKLEENDEVRTPDGLISAQALKDLLSGQYH